MYNPSWGQGEYQRGVERYGAITSREQEALVLSVGQAALLLGVSRRRAYQLFGGPLSRFARRAGRTVFVLKRPLLDWLGASAPGIPQAGPNGESL